MYNCTAQYTRADKLCRKCILSRRFFFLDLFYDECHNILALAKATCELNFFEALSKGEKSVFVWETFLCLGFFGYQITRKLPEVYFPADILQCISFSI